MATEQLDRFRQHIDPVWVEEVVVATDVATLRRRRRLPAGQVIYYQRAGFRPGVLLTSLLDPKKYPAQEIVQLDHERWEILE